MAERLSTGLANKMVGPGGSSMADALNYGVIRIYAGTQPVNSDAVESGTLLVEVTLASASSTVPMTVANGLTFAAAFGGISEKSSGEIWSGVIATGGTAGWFRFYAAAYGVGVSTTAIRFDGSIATSGADMNLGNTVLNAGATCTLDNGQISLPLR